MIQSERQATGVRPGAYTAEIVYSHEQFLQLSQNAQGLLAEHSSTRDPRFYFASVLRNVWSPLAVVVSCAGSVVGIVYAKERKVAGFGLGLIYGDATLDAMVVAEAAHREPVLETALHRLIEHRGSRGLRFLIPSAGYEREVIQKVVDARRLDVHYADVVHHCVLDLGANYEAFLEKMGKKTRRNFRYYRRRFEALGHKYVEQVPWAEFERTAFRLLEKDIVGGDRDGVNRALGMLAAVKEPILVGLRHQNGEWLSILGGWRERGYGVVFFQMNNDRDYAQSALSVVLRGYLIEALIAAKIPELLFWDGVGQPLRRYCRIPSATGVHLDVPTFGWRSVRRLVGWTTNFLPPRLRVVAGWIAPQVPSRGSAMS